VRVASGEVLELHRLTVGLCCYTASYIDGDVSSIIHESIWGKLETFFKKIENH
jgi:hypothetical protein